MKRIITILILLSVAAFPQQLREVVSGSYASFSSVFFLDENNGWASGYGESIYNTTNGGTSWELKFSTEGSSKYFYSVQFLNANTGFAGGGGSAVPLLKKTTDGGNNWTDISFPGSMSIVTVNFINESTGWILVSSADSARIWKTSDGGANWTSVMHNPSGDMEDMQVRSSGKGVAVGGGVGKVDLYYTSDGNTWTRATPPSLGGFSYTRTDIRSVYMVDDNLVYTSGWGSYVGLQPGIFLKSTDGGVSWTFLTQAPENRVYTNVNTLYMKDAMNGVAFGGGSYEGTLGCRTTDGGVNWIPIETTSGFTAQSCYGIGDKVWVAGSGGSITYTSDLGNTWQLLTPVLGSTLEEIKIFGDTIYSAGFNGVFLRSVNKGVDWTSNYTAVGRYCPTINDIHFINPQVGFAARNNKLVTKTTDGGYTWTKIMKDTFATGMINNGIYFFDENNGFVAGRVATNSDVVYKTTNGGTDWTSKINTVSRNLNDITFASTDIGAAAGTGSKIMFTTNGGTSWQVSTVTGLPFSLVSFEGLAYMSTSNAIAVGDKGYALSTDGGATWDYDSIFAKTLKSVAFKDANEGWMVGDRFIFHSTDGGKTWANISDTLVSGATSFNGCAVDRDGYLWIAGGSKVFTFAPFVDVKEGISLPDNYALFQNYPNPFNPSTTIRYTLPSESKLSLNIYDVLGNLVTRLVDENKPAGEYSLVFDAKNLSSGIYFCVMKADGKIFTSKMTLIK